MSGRIDDLSPDQTKALSEFRERIKDVATERCDDIYLLRFLRARSFDLDKAEAKIRATLEFKKKYGADTILKDWKPNSTFENHFPSGFLVGCDKTDHIIVVAAFGNADVKGFVKSQSYEDLIKMKVYEMEELEHKLKENSEKQGRLIETATAIIDLSGLSSYHLWRPGLVLFNEYMQIEEMHYPELVERVFIVNAPKIFPTIWAFVKPFVDPNTRSKLEICGNNYKQRLLEYISEDVLLERYGGKSKDESKICWGGRIPREHYKQNDESLQPQFVKPGKTFTVDVQVEIQGAELSWCFITENHDIGFGIFWKDGEELLEIVPAERLSANLGSIEGSIVCEKVGKYVLEWDNGFSWTKGKNLKYKYELVTKEKKNDSNEFL